jgi:hypothetical protein
MKSGILWGRILEKNWERATWVSEKMSLLCVGEVYRSAVSMKILRHHPFQGGYREFSLYPKMLK